MAETASLNDNQYVNGVPSDDTIRRFRGKHREISYRCHEIKDLVKLKGEKFEHVDPFFRILEQIHNLYPGILKDGDRMWNFDEVKVDAEYGKKVRVFCPSDSHHGGFRSRTIVAGKVRHVTAVMGISASGHVAPPFFIVEGKQMMTNWLKPLNLSCATGSITDTMKDLSKPGWFPENGAIFCSPNGSMQMDIMPRFIDHLNRCVRKTLNDEVHYILTMDNHSSRKGIEWIEKCVEFNCEAVLVSANTSHFLQPCDQDVNKRFQSECRNVRDELVSHGIGDTKSIRFKLMCGVAAISRISIVDVIKSFCVTSLFPFQRNFAERFPKYVVHIADDGDSSSPGDESGAEQDPTFLNVVPSEERTVQDIEEILNGPDEAARKLQQLTILLGERKTTNQIVMKLGEGFSGSSGRNPAAGSTMDKNVAILSGVGSEYVTAGESLRHRREAVAAKQAELMSKEKLKKDREAARSAARLQKTAAKEAKAKIREEKRRGRDMISSLSHVGANVEALAGEFVALASSVRVKGDCLNANAINALRDRSFPHSRGALQSPTKSPARKLAKRFGL